MHKLLLPHVPEAYRQLGRLVAGARGVSRRDKRRYAEGFMRALGHLSTLRRHTNVPQHMAGYFKKSARRGVQARVGGDDYAVIDTSVRPRAGDTSLAVVLETS